MCNFLASQSKRSQVVKSELEVQFMKCLFDRYSPYVHRLLYSLHSKAFV